MEERPSVHIIQVLIVAFAAAVAWACPISIGPFFRMGAEGGQLTPFAETLFSASFALPLGLLPPACLFAAWRLGASRPRWSAALATLSVLAAICVVFVVLAGLADMMVDVGPPRRP